MLKRNIFLAFLFLIEPAMAEEPAKLEDVIADVNSAVVNVVAELKNNEQNLGAGIIIEADGYIVTNAHVTDEAEKIYVITSEGIQYEATLVGDDDKTDIALLKAVHPEGFEPAVFADSDEVRVGNSVFAIGNPFGLGNSVSLGIISAKERDIEKGPYDSFLQTDATINQGNSGGPLFNMQGKIIGVNTAIFSLNGQYAGIGFATPSNTVEWVANQIKQNGKVTRGWLGFGVQKIKSKSENGGYVMVVDNLQENSPATKGGLMVGDIIEEFGEMEINNPRVLSLNISKMPIGTEIPIVVKRDEQKLDLVLKVDIMPDKKKDQTSDEELGLETKEDVSARLKSFSELGIDAKQVINAVDFEQIGIKAYFEEKNREFVVVAVSPQSEAFTKEIKMGDRIINANDERLFGVEDFKFKLKKAEQKGLISLTVLSGTNVYNVNIKVENKNE